MGRVFIPTFPPKPPQRPAAERFLLYRTVMVFRSTEPSRTCETMVLRGRSLREGRRATHWASSRERRTSRTSPAHGGRGIDGPLEGSLRPKAVERSADRRGAVGSSPFNTPKKEPLPGNRYPPRPWHFLNFLPDPQGQGSFRPGSFVAVTGARTRSSARFVTNSLGSCGEGTPPTEPRGTVRP